MIFIKCTGSPRQEATQFKGEQPNFYLENIIQMISHPQSEATFASKPRLVGEHR